MGGAWNGDVVSDGLRVDDAEVRYGAAVAVDAVTISVAPGEIVAVIGPSGCGKSTLLRAVAGLEPLLRGTVRWAGNDLSGIETHRREFGLMFQEHALFPHRDVGENVTFGLRMQQVSTREAAARARDMLDLVGLSGFERRRVDELSGGEAQRVALARALAPRPRLVMLDEPLGSLDRSLRERLAVDIRTTVRELGVAALHVTHDQDEAFAVADRIAVMRRGRLVRDDQPARLWRDPRDEFTARFLGHRDVLTVAVARALGLAPATNGPTFDGVVLLPGALVIDARGSIGATVVDARFSAAAVHVVVAVDGVDLLLNLVVPHGSVSMDEHPQVSVGARVALAPHPERVAPVTLDR